MDKKELATFVHNQVTEAGNYWKVLSILHPYLRKQDIISEAIIPVYMSLQQSFFITMFKIFDTNRKDANQLNIYSLMDDEDKKILSSYNKIIDKIKWHRNKIFAHNTQEKWDMTKEETNKFEELLKCLGEICSHYSEDVWPNYYTRNVNTLERLLEYALQNKE